jgi:hypothetical protein
MVSSPKNLFVNHKSFVIVGLSFPFFPKSLCSLKMNFWKSIPFQLQSKFSRQLFSNGEFTHLPKTSEKIWNRPSKCFEENPKCDFFYAFKKFISKFELENLSAKFVCDWRRNSKCAIFATYLKILFSKCDIFGV